MWLIPTDQLVDVFFTTLANMLFHIFAIKGALPKEFLMQPLECFYHEYNMIINFTGIFF